MNHQIRQRSVFAVSLCVTFLLHVAVSTNSTCLTVDSKSLPRLCSFRSVCREKRCAERRSVSGDGQHLEYRCACDSLCELYGDCCGGAERCPVRLPSDVEVRLCARRHLSKCKYLIKRCTRFRILSSMHAVAR